MKKIDCHRAGVAFCIVAFAISTTAQNTFPATGNVGVSTTVVEKRGENDPACETNR